MGISFNDDFDRLYDRDLEREPSARYERWRPRPHAIAEINAHIAAIACTPASHEAAKADPAQWAAMRPGGVQRIEADDVGPAEALELRTCLLCASTLAKVMTDVECAQLDADLEALAEADDLAASHDRWVDELGGEA